MYAEEETEYLPSSLGVRKREESTRAVAGHPEPPDGGWGARGKGQCWVIKCNIYNFIHHHNMVA